MRPSSPRTPRCGARSSPPATSRLTNNMQARLAVDIGGTFTDLVLETAGRAHAIKVLTTPDAPERAVLAGVRSVLAEARCAASDVVLVVHGTTLATNALIERKGARTALLTTEGFRDS